MRSLPGLTVILTLIWCVVPSSAREWTDSKGKTIAEADFAGVSGGYLDLRKSDGTRIRVPLESLSTSDREYLAKQPAAQVVDDPVPRPNLPASAIPFVPAFEALSKPIKYDFDRTPLLELIARLKTLTTTNIVIDMKSANSRAGITQNPWVPDPNLLITAKGSGRLGEALDRILAPHKLTWIYFAETIVITKDESHVHRHFVEYRFYRPLKGLRDLTLLATNIEAKHFLKPDPRNGKGVYVYHGRLLAYPEGFLLLKAEVRLILQLEREYANRMRVAEIPADPILDRLVDVNEGGTLSESLAKLESRGGFQIVWKPRPGEDKLVDYYKNKPFSLNVRKISLRSALDLITRFAGADWWFENNQVRIPTGRVAENKQYDLRGFPTTGKSSNSEEVFRLFEIGKKRSERDRGTWFTWAEPGIAEFPAHADLHRDFERALIGIRYLAANPSLPKD